MDKSEVTERFKQAKDLVSDVEEPYRAAAFQVVFQRLLEGPEPQVTAAALGTKRHVAPSKAINEFLASKAIKSHNDRVLAIAYYYHKKDESVTGEDIGRAYKDSRLTRPANVSDIIAKLVRKGLLVDASERKDNKKAWQITPSGEQNVDGKLG